MSVEFSLDRRPTHRLLHDIEVVWHIVLVDRVLEVVLSVESVFR